MLKEIISFSIVGSVLITAPSFFSSSAVSTAKTFAVISGDQSPQEAAEEGVGNYIRKKFGQDVQYKPYNFGDVFRLQTNEARQLQELNELRNLLPGMRDHYGNKLDSVITHYDTLIAQKKREIAQKKLKPDYIISHVFTIKKKQGGGTAYEGDFILDHSMAVKDVRIKLAAEMEKDDFDWFYYFFQKYPIFNTGNYEDDVARSNSLFDYYNARLAQLSEGKEEFLLTALRVTRIINKTKKYDKDIIGGFLVMKKMDEKKVCENYKPVKFSSAEEIRVKTTTGDSLIGYKIFHQFECTGSDGKTEGKAIYAELDPYFTPAGFLKVDPPFEKYFEKE